MSLYSLIAYIVSEERLDAILFLFFGGKKGGKEEGREEGRDEGREGGRWGGREGGKGREGRNSSNERDIADLDLEVYKLISFFLREGKEKKK